MYGSAASSKTMSPASIAGLIRGISTTRGYMRPVRELVSYMDLRLRVKTMAPAPMAGLKRDDISAYALRIGERPVIHRPCHLA